jgi:hypothetical protein
MTAPRGRPSAAWPIDDDTVGLARDGSADGVVLVVRLRGAGTVWLPPDLAAPRDPASVMLTTEDDEFTDTPSPPAIDVRGGGLAITFARPGAVLFGR